MNIRYNIDEINSVAKQFLDEFKNNRCFAFFADMGSGKTTFVHALCKALLVNDNISSPTFSIINEYEIPNASHKIIHMDWYRLKNTADAIEAGVQDVMQNNNDYIFIEWPEIAVDLLPANCISVYINFMSESEREITTS
jgi:tRNA threonylcarbamoyladenosine biosynthesis protein TsaE